MGYGEERGGSRSVEIDAGRSRGGADRVRKEGVVLHEAGRQDINREF